MIDDQGLLREMHGDIKVLKSDVDEVKQHLATNNGIVTDMKEDLLRQEGALGMLRWLFIGAVIPLLGIGVAVAGIVLSRV